MGGRGTYINRTQSAHGRSGPVCTGKLNPRPSAPASRMPSSGPAEARLPTAYLPTPPSRLNPLRPAAIGALRGAHAWLFGSDPHFTTRNQAMVNWTLHRPEPSAPFQSIHLSFSPNTDRDATLPPQALGPRPPSTFSTCSFLSFAQLLQNLFPIPQSSQIPVSVSFSSRGYTALTENKDEQAVSP